MSKLTSALIKQHIVDLIKRNPGCIKRLFDPSAHSTIDETELHYTALWKRNHKEAYDGVVVRYFNVSGSKHDFIEDQVTVEVKTDSTDTKILSILIEG